MAFIASAISAAEAFTQIRQQALASKGYLANQRVVLVQATSDAAIPIAIVQHLAVVIERLNAIAGTPGLADYAQAQFANPGYNIVAEYNAMVAAMVALRNGIMSAFPKDGSNFLLWQQFDANGFLIDRTFTSADVSGVVALLDAVLATIS